MKQKYIDRRFSADSEALITYANGIIDRYMAQGYRLTVRQLYYQLVTRNVVTNTVKSYNRVKSLLNDARLAGRVDWNAIEDRTRAFIRRQRFKNGSEILRTAANTFHMNLWYGQVLRPFVLIEKEALAGVLEATCHELDIPLLAARGYPSVSVLREFAQKDILPALKRGNGVMILHLGDHDPSGIDMTRDLKDRLELLTGTTIGWRVTRLALNMSQIDELQPPPNPAKETDARFADYRRRFGDESWELDALEPEYLNRLVRDAAHHCIDDTKAWAKRHEKIRAIKDRISAIATEWENE